MLSESPKDNKRRKEEFIQYAGSGLIDIKGNADSAIFFHKKQPRVVAWEMNWNTLLSFFAGDLPDKQFFYLEEYYKLVNILEHGNISDQGLVKMLKPFLHLLPNATYEIEIVEYPHRYFIIQAGLNKDTSYINGKQVKTISYSSYAGSEPFYLYGTQRYLNKNRVNYYETFITKGSTPLPIILKVKEGAINFIVDGHHKTQAYINLNKPIKVIEISKANNTVINPEQFKQITKGFSQEPELLETLDYLLKNK